MSTTTRSTDSSEDVEFYECNTCGDCYREGTAVGGSFCSQRCHSEHRREKAATDVLETIRKDRRFCSTCFRMFVELEEPPDRWGMPDCVIGFQYRRPSAVTVWKDTHGRARTGVGCTCGNCSHSNADTDLRQRFLVSSAARLVDAVEVLTAEGKLDVEVDRRRLIRTSIDIGELPPALKITVRCVE